MRSRHGVVYSVRIIVAMTFYIVLLITSQYAVDYMTETPWRFVVALLPIIPILVGLWAFMVFVRQIDELERRIHFEAFAFSLGWTGLITFALGLLETAGGPKLSMVLVFPMIILLWGFGSHFARQRYQ